MPLVAGTRVDRYIIAERLGAGGMGEVYRARDPKLERQIALKVVRLDAAPGSNGNARLLREGRAVAALSHPNVLAVYDVGEILEPEELRGTAYIAMELVVGTSLRGFVGDPSVPMSRRVEWLKDVARALAAAHEAGIVHRDVKPENVMVRTDGAVKVLDFGIARRTDATAIALAPGDGALPMQRTDEGVVSALTARGAIVGTPLYMAPEQLRGEPLDGRTDQFAWGVLAYELVTGRLPWNISSDALVIGIQILTSEPPPANEVDREVPFAVSEVIGRAMAKSPEGRFHSMAALLRALEPSSAASEVHAPPSYAPAPAASQTVRRPPSVAILAGWTLGLGALASLVASGALYRRSAAPTASVAASEPAYLDAADACTSSAACALAHGGDAWRCHSQRHVCVSLASEDCVVRAEASDLTRDDTVWLGGLFRTPNGRVDQEALGAELARRDFAAAIGSAVSLADGSHPRPIALVSCDEWTDPLRAAHHLVDDVEVPAVLGFARRQNAAKTLPSIFLPAKVLSIITISQSTGLTKIPGPPGEPRLVWRTTLRAASMAQPIAALVSDVVEPRVRAAGDSSPLRVALLRGTAIPDDFETALFQALRFNGKSALDNGEAYREFVLDAQSDAGIDRVQQAIVDYAPQVIIPQMDDFEARVLVPLERAYDARRGVRRPYYLQDSDFSDAILSFIGKDAERRHRFFGVTNFSTTMPNAQLVLHFNGVYPQAPVTRTTAPQPSYDAFYALAYAAESISDGRVDGPSLSRALDRLRPPGKKVDVGPAAILDTYETLRAGGAIDLNGAIGSLDFDRATGEAPIDYAILCPGVDDRGAASTAIESGLVYDAAARKLTGTFKCR